MSTEVKTLFYIVLHITLLQTQVVSSENVRGYTRDRKGYFSLILFADKDLLSFLRPREISLNYQVLAEQ